MTPVSGDLTRDDALDDFGRRLFRFYEAEKTVFVSGAGPAVVVMAEMPGISPHVLRFARWIREAGFTVYLPSLFGRDGAVPNAEEGLRVMRAACVSVEFRAFGGGATSPVSRWLRSLAAVAHSECGGVGVGAVGMCFTGNFALSMMLEASVVAPVLCQPSLPLDQPGALEISAQELVTVKQRLEREDLSVLGFRFAGDSFCRAERFAAYEAALGERFVGQVLPDPAANAHVPPFFSKHVPTPHSVVTAHLIDEAGQPTRVAVETIVAFLRTRLIRD